MSQTRYKVSVITPFYNREKLIVKCAHRLLAQTLDSIEFIFINDGSNDESTTRLKEYINTSSRKNDVRILDLESNTGVSNARQIGMHTAKGEYIIHCDSDDYFEPDAFELMYTTAHKNDVDFVVCGCKIVSNNETSDFIHPTDCSSSNRNYALKSTISMATLWSHMVRRSFIECYNIYPFAGINNLEDLLCVIRFYYFAKDWSYIHKPLYVYNRTGGDCITKNIGMKTALQMKEAYDIVDYWNTIWDLQLGEQILKMKIFIRECMLSASDFDKKIWMSTYPEVRDLEKKAKSKFNIIHFWSYCLAINYGVIWPYKLLSNLVNYLKKATTT